MSDAFLVLVRIHPRAYFCTVVAGRLVFDTANESQKWMLRPCLNVEIESVHIICFMTNSVDRSYFGSKRPY